MRRKTGVQGEEIVQDLLNFSDWECNRVGKNGLDFRDWACGNIGHQFRELLELIFSSLFPKTAFCLR